MLETLLELDKNLFLFLNNLGTEFWDPFWLFYTYKFNWIPLYAILLFLLYKHLGRRNTLILILVTVVLVVFTDQITNVFKHGFKRLRPCHEINLQDIMRIVRKGCGGYFGFFSGHSSNSMAIAVFVGLLLRDKYKYLIFLLLFWSALMAYSRVYLGVHYPLDIICGMTFGAFSGFIFYKVQCYLSRHFISQ